MMTADDTQRQVIETVSVLMVETFGERALSVAENQATMSDQADVKSTWNAIVRQIAHGQLSIGAERGTPP